MCWDNVSIGMGKALEGLRKLCAMVGTVGGEMATSIVSNSVPMKTKRQKAASHLFSAALNGSVSCFWSVST